VRAVINHAAAATGFDPPAVGESVYESLDFHLEQIENNADKSQSFSCCMSARTLHLREIPRFFGVSMTVEFKNLVTGLYDLLLPIPDAEVRKRAVKSALMMLGDDPGIVDQKHKPSGGGGNDEADDGDDFNAKTKTWMKQNKLTAEQLGHVFHIDGENVEIIAHKVPGENLRDQVVNTYVLMGLRELIRNGNPNF
jgi:hypothetical protein